MATVWLDPDAVAERLGVCRKTAVCMMYQMDYRVISGSTRKRIRVSEEALDAWVNRGHSGSKASAGAARFGTQMKIPRRTRT